VPDGIELVEPMFLKPDHALAVLVRLCFDDHSSERQRARNGLIGFGGDGDVDYSVWI
jgi:hypothetical protein